MENLWIGSGGIWEQIQERERTCGEILGGQFGRPVEDPEDQRGSTTELQLGEYRSKRTPSRLSLEIVVLRILCSLADLKLRENFEF